MGNKEEINRLLSEAAKFYAAKDFEKSTKLYSEVNALFDALTGSSNPDYLFLYGKSLYQLALGQSEIFGGEGDNGGAGDEEDSAEEDTRKSKLYQFSDTLAEEEGETVEAAEEANENEEEVEAEEEVKEQTTTKQGTEEAEGGDAEEPSDFENAWEILELARSLYESQPEEAGTSEKLSETYDILGEISLETENFAQAKEDFTKCLELRLAAYGSQDKTHRLIIESYYKISLALEFDPSQATACQENLNKAITLLEKRTKEKGYEKGDEGLLEELKLKLKELETTENTLKAIKDQSLAQIKQALTGGDSGKTAAAVPVNDLTSMVKKRKAVPKKDSDAKKHKK